jgi:hypothetical protein
MRAMMCTEWGGPEVLALQDVPDPVPKQGEVLIGMAAAGVNFPDVLIIQKKYQVQPELPFIPGAEIAGEVIALGDGVTHLKTGDRVAALCTIGGFAEKLAVDASKCMKIPRELDDITAAGFVLAMAHPGTPSATGRRCSRVRPCWSWGRPAASASPPWKSARPPAPAWSPPHPPTRNWTSARRMARMR